jgi:hypothetical protein
MKKMIPVLMIGYISIIGGLNCASAQKSQNSFKFEGLNFEKMEQVQPEVATLTPNPEATPDIPLASVSKRALNDFHKSFKNAPDAKWYGTKEGDLMATFSNGDIKTRVYYSKKGTWTATIRDYTEENLPKDVRQVVKSTYYDFSIYHIAEVMIDNQTVYVITLEDKTSWKKIRVIDGELIEDHTYVKG